MMSASLRLIFMGTPAFAVPALQTLLDSPHQVIAAYSQPPRPRGRGQQIQKSPVQLLAEAHHIPVLTPLSFKKDPQAVAAFAALEADAVIVAAYGLILPQTVLEAPRFGCLNIHASLLPRWRGASPIQHAIWKGDLVSGVTIMQMDAGLDTGAMLLKSEVPLAGLTAAELQDRLSVMGGQLVMQVLSRLAAGEKPHAEKQDNSATVYAPLLKKEDGRIDWTQTAAGIDAQVRALNPWPGTFTLNGEGRRLKILKGEVSADHTQAPGTICDRTGIVACGGGTGYRMLSVQPDNAKPMDVTAALNGGYLKVSGRFS